MSHHPSCKPGDRALIYKCTQCGTEEATHLEDIRAELLRTQEQLVRTIDSKPALIARINELEAMKKPVELHLLTDDELKNQVTIHTNMLYEIKNEQELRVALRQEERDSLQLKMDIGG